MRYEDKQLLKILNDYSRQLEFYQNLLKNEIKYQEGHIKLKNLNQLTDSLYNSKSFKT